MVGHFWAYFCRADVTRTVGGMDRSRAGQPNPAPNLPLRHGPRSWGFSPKTRHKFRPLRKSEALRAQVRPWHFLNFNPLPQRQGSFLSGFAGPGVGVRRPSSSARILMMPPAGWRRLSKSAMSRIGRSVWAKKAFRPSQSQFSPGSPLRVARTLFLGHSP
jgi:hypothetical protein